MSNNLKLTLMAVSALIGICSTYVYLAARNHAQRQTVAMTLIRDIDSIDQQLSQASAEFGFALKQFLENVDSDDMSTLRQSHHTLGESVNRSIAIVSQLTPPESEHGDGFISAERKFLLVQRKIIREDFAKLLSSLEDESISRRQRGGSVQTTVNKAYLVTEREFSSVQAIRDKFAAEFAIRLTTQR